MAVWQFCIDFVPEQFLLDTFGYLPQTVSLATRKAGDYFRGAGVAAAGLLPALQRLGTLEDWTRNITGIKRYRGQADNDITIYFDEQTGLVQELSGRVDLRQPAEAFLHGLLSLAAGLNCQLLANPGDLFEPTVPALLQAMEASAAQRFVRNPLQFLIDLSAEDTDKPLAE